MTNIRYYIRDTDWGMVIEICYRIPDGTYRTASLRWRSKTRDIPEDKQFLSYETARTELDRLLKGRSVQND